MGEYTEAHGLSGLRERLPPLTTWPNQYSDYEVVLTFPEFTSVCPRTGIADFGTITIRYVPRASCIETKSLKQYLQGYRDLGIFQENAVNRMLEDVVAACEPRAVVVIGEFNARGGIASRVVCRYPRQATAEDGPVTPPRAVASPSS